MQPNMNNLFGAKTGLKRDLVATSEPVVKAEIEDEEAEAGPAYVKRSREEWNKEVSDAPSKISMNCLFTCGTVSLTQ